MKGVILAGGLGRRLYPLTKATNKHLLPVYDRCMVHYAIDNLLKAGIDQILVVTGGPHAGDFIRVLGTGKELGIKHLEYGYQEGRGGFRMRRAWRRTSRKASPSWWCWETTSRMLTWGRRWLSSRVGRTSF